MLPQKFFSLESHKIELINARELYTEGTILPIFWRTIDSVWARKISSVYEYDFYQKEYQFLPVCTNKGWAKKYWFIEMSINSSA